VDRETAADLAARTFRVHPGEVLLGAGVGERQLRWVGK
jgi:hypothetical protein